MAKFKIDHDVPTCIGCMACEAVAEDIWEMDEVGDEFKAKAKKVDFDQDEFEKVNESAEICPVNCIHIIDTESGEKLI